MNKNNFISRHSIIWKWGMYLLSMMLFALIILIYCCPIKLFESI